MRSQLVKIGLVNTSDLTETLTFSVVQEGGAEASRQAVSIEPEGQVVIEDSQTLITSKLYNITVTGYFSTGSLSQLETWQTNQTSLIFTGYGIGGQILQAEGILNFNEGFDGHATFRFESSREAQGGYDSSTGKHTAELSYSKNGLALYKWQEGSTTGLAAGWDKGASITATWDSVNGEQDLSLTSGTFSAFRDIYFPFANQSLTFFINCTAVTATTDPEIRVAAFDNTGTVTSSDTTVNVTSTGVKSATITTGSDVEYIRVFVRLSTGDAISFKNPSLQTSATYSFEEFNT